MTELEKLRAENERFQSAIDNHIVELNNMVERIRSLCLQEQSRRGIHLLLIDEILEIIKEIEL